MSLDAYVPEKTRVYHETTAWNTYCAHCDEGAVTRWDYLRGYVCRDCDSALDAMFNEGKRTPQQEQELEVMRSRGEI